MTRQSIKSVRLGLGALAIVVALAGCKGASPTPQVTQVASTPTPTAAPTATPTAAPSATAAEATAAPSATAATPTAAPSATAAPEASATAAPSASTAASAAPSSVAGACSGTADHQAFFAEAASALSFDAYCASLPSTWWLKTTRYELPNGGLLTIEYTNTKGQTITVGEGNFCAGAPLCWTSISDLGAASFGGLSGSLKLYNADPQYAVYVSPGTTHGYQIIGKGMTQAQFVAIAAGMVKIPKS